MLMGEFLGHTKLASGSEIFLIVYDFLCSLSLKEADSSMVSWGGCEGVISDALLPVSHMQSQWES